MDEYRERRVDEIQRRMKEDRYLYQGYMPARYFGPYNDQMAWNGNRWVEVEDGRSWIENTEQISEEQYLKKLAEMGGTDLS